VRTNIGSPGAVMWYTNLVPSGDQAASAASGIYSLSGPPEVGAPSNWKSSGLEPSPLRVQMETSEPSGENATDRIEGLLNWETFPSVKLR
jgi:hypothetical protein